MGVGHCCVMREVAPNASPLFASFMGNTYGPKYVAQPRLSVERNKEKRAFDQMMAIDCRSLWYAVRNA